MVVARYEYILTTSLTFDDSILVKIEQEEEPTPDNIRIIKRIIIVFFSYMFNQKEKPL